MKKLTSAAPVLLSLVLVGCALEAPVEPEPTPDDTVLIRVGGTAP